MLGNNVLWGDGTHADVCHADILEADNTQLCVDASTLVIWLAHPRGAVCVPDGREVVLDECLREGGISSKQWQMGLGGRTYPDVLVRLALRAVNRGEKVCRRGFGLDDLHRLTGGFDQYASVVRMSHVCSV
jgi:hypothetical protein